MFIKIQKERLADVTSINNQFGRQESLRTRRTSDDLNSKSTINRIPNEAKASISEREKKQDKILLSPINTSNKNFETFNQDVEFGI
jgi:UDP-N-acetylmuramoylalanine-D-glutamate ligase